MYISRSCSFVNSPPRAGSAAFGRGRSLTALADDLAPLPAMRAAPFQRFNWARKNPHYSTNRAPGRKSSRLGSLRDDAGGAAGLHVPEQHAADKVKEQDGKNRQALVAARGRRAPAEDQRAQPAPGDYFRTALLP